MSIRQKQIARSANTVINKFLTSGTFPDVQSVISQVGAAFKDRQVGTPATNFSPIAQLSKTDPVALTGLTNNIAEDLANLYGESIDQVNRIVRDFDYKSTWRQRLAQRIINISAELSSIRPQPPMTISNVINSFANIDIANTSAFVNFSNFSIELPPVSNRTSKVNLSAAKISYSTTSAQSATYGSIEDIYNDSANGAFIVRAIDTAVSSSLTITITLPGTAYISHAMLVGHISAPTSALLTIDSESMSSQNLGISRTASWAFNARAAKTITITLSKNIADAILGKNYIFDFGIQSINLYYEEYVQSGTFQTTRLDFGNRPLGNITLQTQQSTPDNTSIAWSYSVSGAAGNFEPITPGVTKSNLSNITTSLKRIYPVQSTQSPSNIQAVDPIALVNTGQIETDLSVLSSFRASRSPLFNLCRLPDEITGGNVTINRGRNSWKVRSYHYNVLSSNALQDPSPTLADFADPRGNNPAVYFRYQPTEFDLINQYPGLAPNLLSALRLPSIEYAVQGQSDRVMHIFSAHIITNPNLNTDQIQALSNTVVTLPAVFANHRGAVYLNGSPVPLLTKYVGSPTQGTASIAVTISLPFVAGDNYLQIVTNNYIALGGSAFEFGTGVFSTLCAPGGQLTWYADDGPMNEVSLYELQFQTSRNDYSRYAVTDDIVTGEKVIIIRELPTTVYDVAYQAVNTANAPSTLLIRALLKGDNSNPTVTPKISNFSVINSYT